MKFKHNYKIQVTPEQSEQIQKICFERGVDWKVVAGELLCTGEPYLYIGSRISAGDDSIFFSESQNKEISAEDFIAKYGNKFPKWVEEIECPIIRQKVKDNMVGQGKNLASSKPKLTQCVG